MCENLLTLPVQVIEEKEPIVIVSGIKGKWTKVIYGIDTGWVFGGFLYSENYEKNIYAYVKRLVDSIGESKNAIINNLGEPKKYYNKTHENKHWPEKNNIEHFFEYGDLNIVLLETPFDKSFITYLQIHSENNLINFKFINSNIDNVIKEFGYPDESPNNSFVLA